MTQRETHGVQFTRCPECDGTYGVRGLARHRKSAHGVAPVTTTAGKPRKVAGLTDRQRALLAKLAAGPVASDALVDIVGKGLEAKGLARLIEGRWIAA